MSKTITNKEYRELLFIRAYYDIVDGTPIDMIIEGDVKDGGDGGWIDLQGELLEKYPDEEGR